MEVVLTILKFVDQDAPAVDQDAPEEAAASEAAEPMEIGAATDGGGVSSPLTTAPPPAALPAAPVVPPSFAAYARLSARARALLLGLLVEGTVASRACNMEADGRSESIHAAYDVWRHQERARVQLR